MGTVFVQPPSAPNYSVPLTNEDGSTHTLWWRFWKGTPRTYTIACTQATFPNLSAYIAGQFIYVTDFGHMIYWDGKTPVFADGGNRFTVPAASIPNSVGWNAADGSMQFVLNADGSTTRVTLPSIPGAWFRL